MKRPVVIYFIALWSFLVLTYASRFVVEAANTYLGLGSGFSELWRNLRVLALILIAWHSVRLVQLKAFNRWFSVFAFIWFAQIAVWNVIPRLSSSQNFLRTIVGLCIALGASLGSAWYLTRQDFRTFAAAYVAVNEKEQKTRDMEKISRAKLLKK